MMKPAGLPSIGAQSALAPIEPRQASATPSRKVKTPWLSSVNYLKDLRTKKTQLFQQL